MSCYPYVVPRSLISRRHFDPRWPLLHGADNGRTAATSIGMDTTLRAVSGSLTIRDYPPAHARGRFGHFAGPPASTVVSARSRPERSGSRPAPRGPTAL